MNGISVGTQLSAPDGYLNLEASITYYFLRSSSEIGRVLLLQLEVRSTKEVSYKSALRPKRKITPQPLPILHAMSRADFEKGLTRKVIRVEPEQVLLPPWLAELQGLNLDVVDLLRTNARKSHNDRIDEKLEVIYPLVKNFDAVLDSEDPDRMINKHARSLVKQMNETRVRVWFYAYIAFGRNRVALHYPIHKIGNWDRMTTDSAVKRGRPSKRGRQHGYNTDADMLRRIVEGYKAEAEIGVKLSEIWVKVVKSKRFGCRTRQINDGHRQRLEVFHPEGKPFPTLKTFVYHVLKEVGHRKVQLTLFGKVRARSKLQPTRGSFAANTWNLMQRVERDAYAVSELPKGYVEGNPLPPLYVVIKRDTASGLKTGIGFSQGGERASAYRMATFCEAIDKVRFCYLFGMEIRVEQWPSHGVALVDIHDRGAGSTQGAVSRDNTYRPVISEMAPSHSGQSKALVETSNPKTPSNDEAPHHTQSKLTSIELARKAIFELLLFNESWNVGTHIPPDLADQVSRPTPNGLWETLDSLGRNDALEMPFEDAVRAYLDKYPARLTRDGVLLAGRFYRSIDLKRPLDHLDR